MTKFLDFAAPRRIEDAAGIPFISTSEKVWLVNTSGVDAGYLRAGGAKREGDDWFITRTHDVSLRHLTPHLPRFAMLEIVPDVVDLIPESSWAASLASVLTTKSWARLRDAAVKAAGGCVSCGARGRTEGHEVWEYDDEDKVQKLVAIDVLCPECHETQHLGYANLRGRYSLARDRLVALNRIQKVEVETFEDAIFAKFTSRSQFEWTIDLSAIAGHGLSIKGAFERAGPLSIRGEVREGVPVKVTFAGVEIVDGPKCLRFA